VVLHDVVVHAGARIRRAIVDSGVEVPGWATVGSDDPDDAVAIVGPGDDAALSGSVD
jgi:ADP-glucose pyrophosphorylase